MKKHSELSKKRADVFFKEVLGPLVFSKLCSLDVEAAFFPQAIPFGEMLKSKFIRKKIPFAWGPEWTSAVFRIKLPALDKCDSDGAYSLHLDTGGEACLFDSKGNPIQGIDRNHKTFILDNPDKAETFYVEAAAAGPFGITSERVTPWKTAGGPEEFIFRDASIVRTDKNIHRFASLFRALLDLLTVLPVQEKDSQHPLRGSLGFHVSEFNLNAELLFALNESINSFDMNNPSDCEKSAEILENFIDSHKAESSALELSVTGHSHIDVAWLWPLSETKRKCSRTFSSMCRYIEDYPDFIYSQGQAQLYKYTKENYPGLYKRIKKHVQSGRWEAAASMWVEPDCNIISGESLIRQIVYGQKFCEKEFGKTVDFIWLPDVFGYSAAMPQIMKKCGIKYFSTQKISWNQFTRFPHHSFIWKGSDGTGILSHFLPADTYNGRMTAGELRFTSYNFKEKGRSKKALYVYGFGDGGGGVTREQIENSAIFSDLEGLPKLKKSSIGEFFRELEKEYLDLPEWNGELYLEYHRGTYTSQAFIKRENRKNEFLLKTAEFISSLSGNASDDAGNLEKAWELLLLNQFHDIIPGSSIAKVYEDARKDHSQIRTICEKIISSSMKKSAGNGKELIVFNPSPFERKEFIQKGKDHYYAEIPSWGLAKAVKTSKCDDPVKCTDRSLENKYLKVVFNDNGSIKSLIHKESGRECFASPGNVFQFFEDYPVNYDAWDIDIFYQEKPLHLKETVKLEKASGNQFCGRLVCVRKYGSSTFRQTIELKSGSRRLDFITEADWQEKHCLLKAAFPADLLADKAVYEIQFGHVERPNHSNKASDMAMFEVCAHKWADISEEGFGLALLNDCKYGYDCQDSTLRISLLRSPSAPDPHADEGRHQFTYSLMPHSTSFKESGLIKEAYSLNSKLYHCTGSGEEKSFSFASCDADNIVIDTIKRSEDGKDLILRIYESHKKRCSALLSTEWKVLKAFECDMLEEKESELKIRTDGKIELPFKPFEIKTLRLSFRK